MLPVPPPISRGAEDSGEHSWPARAHQLLEDTPSLSICFASWPGVPMLHDHSRPHVLELTLRRLAL